MKEHLRNDPFGVCPQCCLENKPLPSKPLRPYQKDNTFDLINILKAVDVTSKESKIHSSIIEENCICAICYSVCTETVHNDCLHRFCRLCITKSLGIETCKNKCPICKNGISSKRSLYADQGMDATIKEFNNLHRKWRC